MHGRERAARLYVNAYVRLYEPDSGSLFHIWYKGETLTWVYVAPVPLVMGIYVAPGRRNKTRDYVVAVMHVGTG